MPSSFRLKSLLFLFVLCATCPLIHADVARPCTPSFPFKDGWWGADAAYSIPLPDGRSVWIFGDTMVGDKRVVEGNEPRMVRNSIGVSRCSNGEWQMQYAIRHNATGQNLDFFQAPTKQTWYWALDGFVHGKDLWVTLLCMRTPRVKRPDGFDFETCGADLARVSDLDADPQNWKVKYFPLVADGVAAYPSATAVVDGDYAYIFALYEHGARPMVLTRIPLKGLDSPTDNLQYLSKSGAWKAGLKPDDAKEVMDQGVTEMSARYHADRKQWLAVVKSPDVSSSEVLLRTAKNLGGPWSAAEVIYHIPELQKDSPGYDGATICYAGKEHPEFEAGGSLLFTYVCNTTKIPDLVTRPDIYVPKVVQFPMPGKGGKP